MLNADLNKEGHGRAKVSHLYLNSNPTVARLTLRNLRNQKIGILSLSNLAILPSLSPSMGILVMSFCYGGSMARILGPPLPMIGCEIYAD